MSEKKVWVITGAARGMGADIAKAALAAGHVSIATARNAVYLSGPLVRRAVVPVAR